MSGQVEQSAPALLPIPKPMHSIDRAAPGIRARLDRSTVLVAVTFAVVPLLPALAGGVGLQPYFGAVLLVALLATLLGHDHIARQRPLVLGDAAIGAALLVLGAVVGSTRAAHFGSVVFGMLPLFSLLAAMFAVCLVVRSARDANRIGGALLVAATAISTLGIIGYVEFRSAFAAGAATESDRASKLATALYPHSYIAAQVILPIVPFVLALMLSGAGRKFRIAGLIGSAPILAYLALTLSRSVWIALVVSCGLVAVSAARRYAATRGRRFSDHSWLPRTIAAALVVAVALVGILTSWLDPILSAALARLSTLFDPGAMTFNFSRIQVWSDALRLATDNLPFGVGAGQFAAAFATYDEGHRYIPHAHNQYIQSLCETGITGLVGLLLVVGGSAAFAGRALQVVDRGDRADAPSVRGAFGALVAFALIACFETPLLHVPSAMELGIFSAIALTLGARIVKPRAHPVGLPAARLVTAAPFARRVAMTLAALLFVGFTLHTIAAVVGFRARDAYQRGDYVEAARLAEKALRFQPDLDWAHWLTAQANRGSGDYAAADQAFRRYAGYVSRVPQAQIDQALVLGHLQRHDESLTLLQDARGRAPIELLLDIDFHLANTFTYLGRDEEARILYFDLIERKGFNRFPDLLRRLVECLNRLHREKEVAASLLLNYERARKAKHAATAD